jgi:uncharacterized protein (TIGR03083 family)
LSYLETLTPPRWDDPTLCDDWRVRDVVAHLIPGWAADFRHLPYIIRDYREVDRAFTRYARHRARVDVAVLLKQYQHKVDSHHIPPVVTPALNWCDNVIHGLDIRRPAGLRYPGRLENLTDVAECLTGMTWPSRQTCRSADLQLVATDIDWTVGTGPQVRGPIEDIVLAIAGRSVGDSDLEGDGIQVLARQG